MSSNATTLDKSVFCGSSIFVNIVVYETVSPEKLFNIIYTADLIQFNTKRYEDGPGKLYKTERDLLIAYKYQWVDIFNTFVSEWYLAKHGWGRVNPKQYLSMSVFHRPTRHTLCNDYLVDLDLVNCHYEIVLSKLRELNMPCEHIQLYCSNVSAYREEVAQFYNVSKDTAKQLFIRLIYGGTVNGWMKDNNINTHRVPQIIENIADELEELIQVVWNGNQHIYNDIIESDPKYFNGKTPSQKQRTIMAFWCQSIERFIQEQCIMHLVDTHECELKYFIPCQDGFMMRRQDYKPEYVEELNTYIRDSLHMVSRFIEKPFNERYFVNTPSNEHIYKPFNLLNAEDAQYAQYLIDVGFDYTDIIATGDDKIIEAYQYNGIYWEALGLNNSEFHKGRFDFLQAWCEKKILLLRRVSICFNRDMPDVEDGELSDRVKTTSKELTKMNNDKNATNTQITLKKKQLHDLKLRVHVFKTLDKINDYIRNLSKNSMRKNIIEIYLSKLHRSNIKWDADPELFAFENCIMDLSTGQFVQPRKEQYIRTSCKWSWDKEYDNSKIERISTLVNSILPIEAVRDYYLTYESTGLSGNKVQRILISTGGGGNGKSILRELKNMVLGDYGTKIPNDVLCSPINGMGPNPVIANMSGKRSLYFSEPDAGKKIHSNTLKEITGDNNIVGRGLYSSKTEVVMIATLSGDCNNIPLFTDITEGSKQSMIRRLAVAPFITKAVSEEAYHAAKDKTYLNIREDYAENKRWQDDHKQAYFHILLQAYQRFKNIKNVLDNLPEECKDRAMAHLNASCDIMAWVNTELEPCDIEGSRAWPLTVLYEKFKGNDRFRTYTKAEQRKYSRKYFIDLLQSAPELKNNILGRKKRHAGVQLSADCLVGYRFISYGIVDDEVDELDA
jgi:hypothetical protein